MSFLRSAMRVIEKKPCRSRVLKLKAQKRAALARMKNQYPHVLISNEFHNKIAYMLRPETPQEIVAVGGFVTNSDLWLANITGSNLNTCNSKGTICLTLLPEITTIFLADRALEKKRYFIYALPLDGEFVLLGGKWRQVISPGSLPLPEVWRSREVLKIKNGEVLLGPLIGQGNDALVSRGERYESYLHRKINIPRSIGLGEDFPEEYDIADTEMTEKFLDQVNKHYQKIMMGEKKQAKF